MNKVILMGRLTRDPEVRYTNNAEGSVCVARFSLAVDRRKTSSNQEPGADFISTVAFGKTAEFIEKYGKKGTKFLVTGRIQTGNYTNKEGVKVYTTDVVAEEVEFAESKGSGTTTTTIPGINAPVEVENDGFMNVPEGIGEDELPFASVR